jgi:hypothetical protein
MSQELPRSLSRRDPETQRLVKVFCSAKLSGGRADEDFLFEIDDDNAVGQLFEHRAEGLSLRQIAASLNEGGYTTMAGTPWTVYRVRRALADS